MLEDTFFSAIITFFCGNWFEKGIMSVLFIKCLIHSRITKLMPVGEAFLQSTPRIW